MLLYIRVFPAPLLQQMYCFNCSKTIKIMQNPINSLRLNLGYTVGAYVFKRGVLS